MFSDVLCKMCVFFAGTSVGSPELYVSTENRGVRRGDSRGFDRTPPFANWIAKYFTQIIPQGNLHASKHLPVSSGSAIQIVNRASVAQSVKIHLAHAHCTNCACV